MIGSPPQFPMYLRALEASRFLKINICEILWLLKQLREEGIEFKNVNIVISAFRVQIKDKFNCFLKASIDEMDPTKLSIKVSNGRFAEICQMLEEKKAATETITNDNGLKILYKAMETTNEERDADGKEKMYSESLMKKIKEILEIYQKLDKVHSQRSIQSEEERTYDKQIEGKLGEIISDFSNLKEKEEK